MEVVVGEREIIYLSLHCHHQNDSCIKMGNNESHINVSFIIRDKVTRQCPQTTTFEEKGELKRIRTGVALHNSLMPYRLARPTHRYPSPLSPSLQWFLRTQSTVKDSGKGRVDVGAHTGRHVLYVDPTFLPITCVELFGDYSIFLPQRMGSKRVRKTQCSCPSMQLLTQTQHLAFQWLLNVMLPHLIRLIRLPLEY